MGKKWGNQISKVYLRQNRDAKGKFAGGGGISRVGIVPYVRTSLRGTTGGLNAGAQVSKKKRVSAGFYLRVENTGPSGLEKKIKSADRSVMDSIVGKISPDKALDPYIEAGVRKLEQDLVTKSGIGKERQLSKKSHGRLTTTRNGMPSYTVRFGSPKFKDEKTRTKSRNAQVAYSKQMAAGKKVKNSRAQRRG